jgi:hypothetical protein
VDGRAGAEWLLVSSSTAAELADRFEGVAGEFAGYIEGLSPEQWRAVCGNHPTIRVGDEDENRPVGVVAHHLAVALPYQVAMLRAVAEGAEVPQPNPQGTALHARANPDPDRRETVELFRQNAAEAAGVARGLSDEELARSGHTFRGELTAAEVVSRIMVGHVAWHRGSIEATLGHPLSTPRS